MPVELPATNAGGGGAGQDRFHLPAPLQWRDEATDNPPDAGEVHLWRIALDAGTARYSLEALASAERDRAAAFRFDIDRDRYVIGRYTLRRILGSYLRLAPGAVPIAVGVHGKPYLAGSQPVEFNLSHSGSLALLAVVLHGRLGVDLETLRPQSDTLALACLSFTAGEQAALAELAAPARDHAFLSCWTRKEAVLKASGVGLVEDLGACHAGIGPEPTSVRLPPGVGQPPLPVVSLRPDGAHVAGLSGDVLAGPWSLRAMAFDDVSS